MYCENCGKKLIRGYQFCIECGTPVPPEQGEEETNANDLISKMELFGSDPKGLYMLNQELAARVYSAPSLVL